MPKTQLELLRAATERYFEEQFIDKGYKLRRPDKLLQRFMALTMPPSLPKKEEPTAGDSTAPVDELSKEVDEHASASPPTLEPVGRPKEAMNGK